MHENIGKRRLKRGVCPAGSAILLLFAFSYAWAGQEETGLRTGRELYNAACAACHGVDGTGRPESTVGFDLPLPDLTDCNFASREPNGDWYYVVAEGGPARAFDKMMPAFGEALTDQEIEKTLNYIRTFCKDDNWPRGEFNLPRPLVTTKAYPEDEWVFATSLKLEGRDRVANEVIYEKRFGARNQFELILPFGWNERLDSAGDTDWRGSVGDVGVGLKRAVYHNLDSGAILTFGGEVFFPTGDEDNGFGSDTTLFEPYVAYGQILPNDFFLHFQGGAELPAESGDANEEVFWRGVLGHTFSVGKYGYGVSPMVELLGSRELISDADENWDLVPQVQIPLNTRQHVLLNLGVRFPLNDTDTRDTTYAFYVLWDFFDGGFFEGW